MTYENALEYIHGINWTFCKPGLERIRELCERLGNPQDSLKFIHVGGTNGKGSFCSMLSSVLVESGLRVGLYTSPFILRFNERMRINGVEIPDGTLASLTERVRPIADSMTDKPTEFELITAIALLYFAEEKVDVVVFECGMGGRLDSTNVIKTPLLSVITGVALDHTAYLGNTVEAIAAEKAGIIKPGVPVLFGGEDESARAVIASAAERSGSELYCADYSELRIKRADLSGALFDYKSHKNVDISLLGFYQPRNAALVLEALDIIKKTFPTVTEESILRGLKLARWKARFEKLCDNPLIIFDGAHNPEGIHSAVESILGYFEKECVIAISGVLKDKDYRVIASELSKVASHAFTITPGSPRALGADDYAEVLSQNGIVAEAAASVDEALRKARKLAAELSRPIVCLGSLYTYIDFSRAVNADM